MGGGIISNSNVSTRELGGKMAKFDCRGTTFVQTIGDDRQRSTTMDSRGCMDNVSHHLRISVMSIHDELALQI